MQANKTLKPFGLQLYLYLASNMDNYNLALSPAAALEYAGIRSTSFHKYMRLLETEGYLVWRKGNQFDFYTSPRPENERTDPDEHVDFLSFSKEVRETNPPISPNESINSVKRTLPPRNESFLSFNDPFIPPFNKEIDNRYINNNRVSKINKFTDAGTPRTPDSHGAEAPCSPSEDRIIIIPPPVPHPKKYRR